MKISMNLNKEANKYDVVVVGGGTSGLCAAIACARHGAKTALIQNRPMLGGNASSEIRMHICGADHHGARPEARETGIIEEILLSNRKINPHHSFSIFDTVIWEKAAFQENLDLYLNTHMFEVEQESGLIKKITSIQITTEKILEFQADIFVDATGDGMLAYLAGAEYMTGREGRDEFGEKYAPKERDNITMGNSLLFTSKDIGTPIDFKKPSWAYTYEESELRFREHTGVDAGYWWIELGGDTNDVIKDCEYIRDELLKCVYGVWDHIKNGGNHGAENLVLDWIGFLPGKRESRRIVGDYILTANDLFDGKVFDDAVAYGGWPMDMHIPGGLKSTIDEPTNFINMKDVYTIPYRSLYSKNIGNLTLAGRGISVSHMAFGSTRDMATTSVVGQAVGTACALAIKKGVLPKGMNQHISQLQQTLIKDDCYIPGFRNDNTDDFAKAAHVSCSTQTTGGEASNVINGIPRKVVNYPQGWCYWENKGIIPSNAVVDNNCWISNEIGEKGEWISFRFNKEINPKEIRLKFDSNLSKEIVPSIEKRVLEKQTPGIPKQLVKDYIIEYFNDGEFISSEEILDNYYRFKTHKAPAHIICDQVIIKILSTNGDKHARIFEVSIY